MRHQLCLLTTTLLRRLTPLSPIQMSAVDHRNIRTLKSHRQVHRRKVNQNQQMLCEKEKESRTLKYSRLFAPPTTIIIADVALLAASTAAPLARDDAAAIAPAISAASATQSTLGDVGGATVPSPPSTSSFSSLLSSSTEGCCWCNCLRSLAACQRRRSELDGIVTARTIACPIRLRR